MPLYTFFLHSLLNVLVQIANKMGLQKKELIPPTASHPSAGAGAVGQIVTEVPSGFSHTNPQETN
jgi:hypothetical protein